MTILPPRATLADLSRVEGKAELIDGSIVSLMPSGYRPHEIAFCIARGLHQYAKAHKNGRACGDNLGFAVPRLPSGRESFSPNAAFFTHAPPANRMRFIEGAPAFAVEVRSENDYDATAGQRIVAEREDYFLAGTLVVWDVDPVDETITCYRAGDPMHPVVYYRSEIAEADLAVPGWRLSVDEAFEDR